jgi:hypothetical protein
MEPSRGAGTATSMVDDCMDEQDMIQRFIFASQAMKKFDEDEQDELPSTLHEVMAHGPPSSSNFSHKRAKTDSSATLDSWHPPDADFDVEVPGELVLARTRARVLYYPARVREYIPPATKHEDPLYEVEYLNEEVSKIPRRYFFTQLEDGFRTCKVGWNLVQRSVFDEFSLHVAIVAWWLRKRRSRR